MGPQHRGSFRALGELYLRIAFFTIRLDNPTVVLQLSFLFGASALEVLIGRPLLCGKTAISFAVHLE